MPDIFIPRDTVGLNSYFNTVVNSRLDEQYAMMYSDSNRKNLSSFDTWSELYRFLRQQPLLLNLVSYADNNGVRRRPYYIQESSELFEKNLHAYIIRNFFGEEAFWAAYYKDDPLIHKGIELIETKKTERDSIIKEEYK
jgi:carboxyl-terminal processing protease